MDTTDDDADDSNSDAESDSGPEVKEQAHTVHVHVQYQ